MRRLLVLCVPALVLALGCRREDAPIEPKDKQNEPPQARMPENEALARKQIARRGDGKDRRIRGENEALARKQRSIARLRAEGVPVNEGLPTIETEAEAKFRTTEQAALRAMTLCIVASRAEGLDEKTTEKLISDFRLPDTLTPKEKKFIFNPKPSDHDRLQLVCRYECYWVLLWALGFVEDLERPQNNCDVKRSVRILRDHGREEFLKKAKLRSNKEILDAADLIYRYHWAVRDAQLNGRKVPAGLDPDVVMERHYVLNWLVGYGDLDWDDVATDT
jgi:uncharacterized protein DUF4272